MDGTHSALKILELAVVILLTVSIIGAVFLLVNKGKSLYGNSTNSISDITDVTADLSSLDGYKVSGAVAKYYAFQLYGKKSVFFVTKNCPSGFNEITTINDSTTNTYVANSDEFICSVAKRDGVTLGIMFTQVGVDPVEFVESAGQSELAEKDEALALQQYKLQEQLNTVSELKHRYSVAKKEIYNAAGKFVDFQSEAEVQQKIKDLKENLARKTGIQGDINNDTVEDKLGDMRDDLQSVKNQISELKAELGL